MLPALPHFLLKVANALLDREPWARDRLRRHANKHIALRVEPRLWRFRIDQRGYLTAGNDAEPAQVEVRLAPQNLASWLGASAEERLQQLHIQGEAALAQTLAELATHLRWDLEDELAQRLGDVPARQLMQTGRLLGTQLRLFARRLSGNMTDYLVYESHALPARAEVGQWQAEVQRLETDAERLLQRAAALQRDRQTIA